MMTEKQICCICFNIASDGSKVDGDILDLLKFIIAHIKTSALENSTVCNGCLNIILEICNYKTRNSLKTLVETTIETDSEKPRCQKCEKTCEGEDTFPLMNSVTQIDWSDFVNYLFPDQDSQSLESSQICDSCRISVSNIQRFLMLICIHDPSKVKCAIDYGDDIKTTGNQTLVGEIVEVKEEFENVIDKETEIKNVIEDNKTEIICIDDDDDDDDDNATYADFKCKNEEVELKLEEDDNQSTFRCEKVDVGKEMTSNKDSSKNEDGPEVNAQGCSYRLIYDLKGHNVRNLKCIYCPATFITKLPLDNHLLIYHNSSNDITSKSYSCNKCHYIAREESDIMSHSLKHESTDHFQILKCQLCTYQTYRNYYLYLHMNVHNICNYCSKEFKVKLLLDDHMLTVHKCRDSITSKIYECDKCSYGTTQKRNFLNHKLQHKKSKYKLHNYIN